MSKPKTMELTIHIHPDKTCGGLSVQEKVGGDGGIYMVGCVRGYNGGRSRWVEPGCWVGIFGRR